jgi:hypothetical protein
MARSNATMAAGWEMRRFKRTDQKMPQLAEYVLITCTSGLDRESSHQSASRLGFRQKSPEY